METGKLQNYGDKITTVMETEYSKNYVEILSKLLWRHNNNIITVTL
jgi:hypothetical protein